MPRVVRVQPWTDQHPQWHQPGSGARQMPMTANGIYRELATWPVERQRHALLVMYEVALACHPVAPAAELVVLYRRHRDGVAITDEEIEPPMAACREVYEAGARQRAETHGHRVYRALPGAVRFQAARRLTPDAALSWIALRLGSAILRGPEPFTPDPPVSPSPAAVAGVVGACATIGSKRHRLWHRWWAALQCRLAFRHDDLPESGS